MEFSKKSIKEVGQWLLKENFSESIVNCFEGELIGASAASPYLVNSTSTSSVCLSVCVCVCHGPA